MAKLAGGLPPCDPGTYLHLGIKVPTDGRRHHSSMGTEAGETGAIPRESHCYNQYGPSLILPEDVQQLVDKIRKHCKKIRVARVNLPSSSIPLVLIVSYPPTRKNLRSSWMCATILSNVLAIVPSSSSSLNMMRSKGSSIVPRHPMLR